MKKVLLFICILTGVISCNKIKENKFVGIYEGTFVHDYESSISIAGDGLPPFEAVKEHKESQKSYEVYRNGDELIITGHETRPIKLSDMDKNGGGAQYYGGGHKVHDLAINKDKLTISFSSINVGPEYDTSIKSEFIGFKIKK